MSSFQSHFAAQYDHFANTPDCGSPMPGYASHLVPEPGCPYYGRDTYCIDGLLPFVMDALPDASPFQMRYDLHGHTESCSSQTFSERHDSPFGSEFVSTSPRFLSDYGETWHLHGHSRTTSMSNIQTFPDQTPELELHDAEPMWMSNGYMAHDGYVPSEDTASSVTAQTPESTTIEQPCLRQRRSAARASFSKPPAHRINKRTIPKRSATLSSTSAVESDIDEDTIPPRPFHCPLAPYGCPSTFGSKNEWKRHFSTQHLRLEYWRCDKCPATPGKKPNDFNRRDLFTQHVRRMHSHDQPQRKTPKKSPKNDDSEQQIVLAASRCHRHLRSPPSKSICVVCKKAFLGVSSWDDRMEHLGRHFEGIKKENDQSEWPLDVKSWAKDTDVEKWMIEHGILSQRLEIMAGTDDLKE